RPRRVLPPPPGRGIRPAGGPVGGRCPGVPGRGRGGRALRHGKSRAARGGRPGTRLRGEEAAVTTRVLTMAEALRDALAVALRADPAVFLLGEDLGVPGGFGGGFTVTLGLAEEFGHDRVMDTPISEAAIVGAAVGAAMTGMRPVAEMQYGDFVFCAMDQVVNQAAKMCYMSEIGRASCRERA